MWEGVVGRCDVCHNHPRSLLKGDEKTNRLGEGLGWYAEPLSQFISPFTCLPSVNPQWYFSNICSSQLTLFLHIPPHNCNPDHVRGISSCFIFMQDSHNSSWFVVKMELTENDIQEAMLASQKQLRDYPLSLLSPFQKTNVCRNPAEKL